MVYGSGGSMATARQIVDTRLTLQGLTVREWATLWPERATADRSEGTWEHYRERVSAFVMEFGERTLDSFDRDEAREWAETHRGQLAGVRAMFSDAEREGLIPVNPFTRLGLSPSERVKVGVLTPDEMKHLKAVATSVHGPYGRVVYGPMLAVAAWAGLEPGELYGLCPRAVDLERCCLTIDRTMQGRWPPELKSVPPREVPVLWPTEDELRFVGVKELPPDEPIFRTQQGKWVHQRLQAHYWQPVRDRFAAELPADHWLNRRIAERGDRGRLMMGELRHLFGAQLAEHGISPSDIATLMGDKDGGKRAEGLYFRQQSGSAVQRALDAFPRVEARSLPSG